MKINKPIPKCAPLIALLSFSAGSLWAYTNPLESGGITTITNDWNLTADIDGLFVGATTADNTLEITEAGSVSNLSGHVGHAASANHNTVTVQGNWINQQHVTLGFDGSENGILVEAGGRVFSTALLLGQNSGALSNQVALSGQGAHWTTADIIVGHAGSSNQIMLSSGSIITNTSTTLGNEATAHHNQLNLSDGGTHWQSSGSMVVGRGGSSNLLSVTQGATLHTASAMIGRETTAQGNQARLSGRDTQWNATGLLHVGYNGSFNQLAITNEAHLSSSGAHIGFGGLAAHNRILVSGSNTVWNNAGALSVGYQGANNQLTVSDGAQVSAQELSVGTFSSSSNNLVTLSGNGSTLKNSANTFIGNIGAHNTLLLSDGARLEGAHARIGWNLGADFNQVQLAGSSTLWTNSGSVVLGDAGARNQLQLSAGAHLSAADLQLGAQTTSTNNTLTLDGNQTSLTIASTITLGAEGAANTLQLTQGASARATHLIVGREASSEANQLLLSGAETHLTLTDQLVLGGYLDGSNLWVNGGTDNQLDVLEGATLSAGDLQNRNQSTIHLDDTSHISVENYYQDASSVLRIDVSTNAIPQPLNGWIDASATAELEADSTIALASGMGTLSFDRYYTNAVISANELIIAGQTNATTADLEQLHISGSLLYADFYVMDQDIVARYRREYLANTAGFAPGSDLYTLAHEIDEAGLSGSELATTQIHLLNGMSGTQQAAELKQLYQYTTPNYKHQQAMLTGVEATRVRRGRYPAKTSSPAPAGAAGPRSADQHLNGWMKGYGGTSAGDASGPFSNYDQDIGGLVLGIDYAAGEWLFGIAGGAAVSDLTQDDQDTSKASTGYGVLYSAWGTNDWFIDMNLALGFSDIETTSGTAFDTTGDVSAAHYFGYLGVGRTLPIATGAHLIPELALQIGLYDQDSYTETSSTALPRHIEGYERWSYQTHLGATFKWTSETKHLRLQPHIQAHWIHEFNANDDSLTYRVNNGVNHTLFIQGTDDDLIKAGLGLALLFPNRWELSADLNAYAGSQTTSTLFSGRLAREF